MIHVSLDKATKKEYVYISLRRLAVHHRVVDNLTTGIITDTTQITKYNHHDVDYPSYLNLLLFPYSVLNS